MIKKICFFSADFAFNRLNRVRFYEEVFPKDVAIFLFTTHKSDKWDLNRTKIIVECTHPLKLPFALRRFCRQNKIDRIINLGVDPTCILFLFSLLLTKTEYIVNVLGWIYKRYTSRMLSAARILLLYISIPLSRRVIFNDAIDLKKTQRIFPFKEMRYLTAPANTNLFTPKNRISCRKKLGLPLDKKIVVFVGRLNHGKGADILFNLINSNKDILFIAIGKIYYESFINFTAKNFMHYEKKSSKELVDYYNAADLGFFVQRAMGGGLGIAAEECMACGVPAVTRKWNGFMKSPALFQVPVNSNEGNKIVRNFFKKSKKEKEQLSKIARTYAEKYYSYNSCEKDYINYYLN